MNNNTVYSRHMYEQLCKGNSKTFQGLNAPEFAREQFEDLAESKIVLNPPKMQEGLYKCRKCGSKKTNSWEKQTRSADEPATTFVMCVECNFTWTIAG